MDFRLATIIVIAVAVFIGQFIYNRVLIPTPKEEVVKRTTSGDSVHDFLDNY